MKKSSGKKASRTRNQLKLDIELETENLRLMRKLYGEEFIDSYAKENLKLLYDKLKFPWAKSLPSYHQLQLTDQG